MDGCDYCGKPGHDWTAHEQAIRDVAEWDEEQTRLEFPFGDHGPESEAHEE